MKNLTKILLMTITAVISSCSHSSEEKLFMVSGYSADNKPDIMLYKLNPEGNTEVLSSFICGDNPSFFTPGQNGLFYFVNEVGFFNAMSGGGITTLRHDHATNTLVRVSSLNQRGGGPCHITLSEDKEYLITANYGSGSVSVVRLNDSGLPERVTDTLFFGDKSHPHMSIYNSGKEIYYVSDLGLDKIYVFKLNAETGNLISADPSFIKLPEGAGPRHMVIDKDCRNLYVISELNSTISVFDIMPKNPVLKQTLSTLPEGYADTSFCADIHISSSGKFLYGSNRGHNSISIFLVSGNGRLTSVGEVSCGGAWPRNFTIDHSDRYMIVGNQRSGFLSLFTIDSKGEPIQETGNSIIFNAPACVRFIK